VGAVAVACRRNADEMPTVDLTLRRQFLQCAGAAAAASVLPRVYRATP
jgi:hypothetical protein